MRHAERLPLLTEILQAPTPDAQDGLPPQHTSAAATREAAAPAGASSGFERGVEPPRTTAAELLPVSEQMARAVLELELEQALREVLEPRLSLLLRETASELALRLEPRMREWLRERGS